VKGTPSGAKRLKEVIIPLDRQGAGTSHDDDLAAKLRYVTEYARYALASAVQ
jgi:hypothetical protein